jgi:hypothetical protein
LAISWGHAVSITLLALLPIATRAAPTPRGVLTPIPLHSGVNRLPNFASDGREGRIVLAWRDNANAHGYDVFLVLLPTKAGANDWNIVGFEDGEDFADTLRDQPHTGEDVVRAVRFVRTWQSGKEVPLVVTATRTIVTSIPRPAQTPIAVYSLQKSDGVPGTTADYFRVIRKWRAKRLYCNAELALKDELRVPVRQNYQGSHAIGGC